MMCSRLPAMVIFVPINAVLIAAILFVSPFPVILLFRDIPVFINNVLTAVVPVVDIPISGEGFPPRLPQSTLRSSSSRLWRHVDLYIMVMYVVELPGY